MNDALLLPGFQINQEQPAADTQAPFRRSLRGRRQSEVDLQRAVQAAESANEARGEYLATVCHEIRNPVSVLIGMMDLALQTALTAEQKEYLRLMKASSDLLLNVVNSNLDLARIESGCLAPEHVDFSLRESLGDVVKMLAIGAQKKGLDLSCDIDPEIPDRLQGDPLRLRQIVLNLLGNAIKFTARGEVVMTVALQSADPGAIVCRFDISDSGPGIPADRQAAIFERYEQAETSTARHYGGTGLGLHISACLVAMMGGTIGVSSQPGHGSTFTFTACFDRPATPHQAAAHFSPVESAHPPRSRLTRAPKYPLRNLVILLVDDNRLSCRFAQLVLEKEGCRVVLADSAARALAILKQEAIDLVLMDLQMPSMDGLEATALIRRQEQTSGAHLPIVALTASSRPEERDHCLAMGMDSYLTKPIRPEKLLELLRRLAESGVWPAAPRGPRHPPIDVQALSISVGFDPHLLDDIVEMFPAHCDALLSKVGNALDAVDEEAYAAGVHTISGMFRNLCTPGALALTAQLQGVDLKREPGQAAALLEQLEKETQRIRVALSEFKIVPFVADGKLLHLPRSKANCGARRRHGAIERPGIVMKASYLHHLRVEAGKPRGSTLHTHISQRSFKS